MPVRRRLQGRWGDLFPALTAHVVASAGLLAEMLGEDADGRRDVVGRLRDVDAAAEQQAHEILSEMAAAFVTPVDRVDVFQVAWSVRLCARACAEAGETLALVPVGLLDETVSAQVQLISSAADVVAESVPKLVHPRVLSQAWLDLNMLRKQAGTAHRAATAAALGDGVVPAEPHAVQAATLWRLRVADHLLAVSSAFENVGGALQQIVVKES